jgi:predicted small metal-binding protein
MLYSLLDAETWMNCPFEATAKNRRRTMKKIAEHASKVRNMKPPFPPDMMAKIKKAIKK